MPITLVFACFAALASPRPPLPRARAPASLIFLEANSFLEYSWGHSFAVQTPKATSTNSPRFWKERCYERVACPDLFAFPPFGRLSRRANEHPGAWRASAVSARGEALARAPNCCLRNGSCNGATDTLAFALVLFFSPLQRPQALSPFSLRARHPALFDPPLSESTACMRAMHCASLTSWQTWVSVGLRLVGSLLLREDRTGVGPSVSLATGPRAVALGASRGGGLATCGMRGAAGVCFSDTGVPHPDSQRSRVSISFVSPFPFPLPLPVPFPCHAAALASSPPAAPCSSAGASPASSWGGSFQRPCSLMSWTSSSQALSMGTPLRTSDLPT